MLTGMTYEEYWDGDVMLPRYYRRMDRMRKQRMNEQLWLQGMYFYEALCDASPIFHDFAKRGTKPIPYAKMPYPIDGEQQEKNKTTEAKQNYSDGRTKMQAWMDSVNARLGAKTKAPEGA